MSKSAELTRQLKEWSNYYKSAQATTQKLLTALRDSKSSADELQKICDQCFPTEPSGAGVTDLVMAEKHSDGDSSSTGDKEEEEPGAGASGSKKKDEEQSNNFNARSISIRAQKKLASKLASKKTMKIFIDDTSARVFDNIYKLLKQYTGSRSKAQKLMKNVIKVNMKLGVLYLNDCLNDEENNLAMEFRDKFIAVAETFIKFHKADYTVDVTPLMSLFSECERIVLQIIARHLTEKSHNKIRNTCAFFSDRVFLETIFKPGSEYQPILKLVADDIQELLDRGII